MSNRNSLPPLPIAYHPIVLDEVESLRDYAIQIARDGAEEGTIVVAKTQANARGRVGKNWNAGTDNLHCSIILRPEFPSEEYPQMAIVSAMALGNALAMHLSPMTALGFGWPNRLLIANHKVAGIWLDSGSSQTPWLGISCSVNIQSAPQDPDMPAISVAEAEGKTELTPFSLLESYSREFISQINHWAERGAPYLIKQWWRRMEKSQQRVFNTSHDKTEGKLIRLDDTGNAWVDDGSLGEKRISIGDYLEMNK